MSHSTRFYNVQSLQLTYGWYGHNRNRVTFSSD